MVQCGVPAVIKFIPAGIPQLSDPSPRYSRNIHTHARGKPADFAGFPPSPSPCTPLLLGGDGGGAVHRCRYTAEPAKRSYVGLVAVGQEQAEDILVPPLLRNCLTLMTFPFLVIISHPRTVVLAIVFTARCYASAVLAMALCPSVRVRVCHKSEFY